MLSLRRLIPLLLTIALLSLSAAASEFTRGMQPPDSAPDSTRIDLIEGADPTGDWVIHFDANTPYSEKMEYLQRIGADLSQGSFERIAQLEVWVVDAAQRFDERFRSDAKLVAGDFYFDSDVELVEQDFTVSAHFRIPPNDPDYERQWALPHIQAETAWSEMGELQPVTVAVIDTGVCMSHEDLVGRVLDGGYDFVDKDDDPEDVFGHGCSVAGIIAANTDNAIGIAGFAPNSSILPIRVLGAGGSGSMADVAAGIVYAADNGADIINLSLGSAVGSQVTEDAVNYAMDKGRHGDCLGGQQRRQPARLSGAL